MTVQKLLLSSIVIICFLQNCKQTNGKRILQEEKPSLYNFRDKFKYQTLGNFQIDTFDFESRRGYYQEADSNVFKLIFQEGDRKFIGQGYDRDYFYSWQERDTNFIEFTILTQDESSYCNLLRYYIFDRKGKFISKFDLASKCGDADWTFSGKGRQVDKNHFAFETVESNMKDGAMPEDEKQEGDSINYLITIEPNGKAIKTESFNKHFKGN